MAPWRQRFLGLTWREMPGHNPIVKRLNFALYRRGLLIVDVSLEYFHGKQRINRRLFEASGHIIQRRAKLNAARRREQAAEESFRMPCRTDLFRSNTGGRS